MANNGLKVSPEVMKEHGETAAKMSEDFKTKINDLKNSKNGLMQIWRGPSATEFDEAVDIQTGKLEEFEGILADMAQKIKEGADNYETTEEENTQESRRLKETEYNYR